jgi:hypothetical protein
MKKFFPAALLCVFFCVFLSTPLFGADYEDGRIRLSLNPQLGRFSLYDLTNAGQALFMDQDPRTSVLTLDYNGKRYRLGESEDFQIREGGSPQQPTLVFDSSFVTVTEEFSFIVTPGSPAANGVKINFRIENKGSRRIQAGLRFLLDTKLGEVSSSPFSTDTQTIEEETVFTAKSSADKYWISGSGDLVLMGSISAGVDRVPDTIHIANWKRLDEEPWSLAFVEGRKFNNPPYSIRDSAVAYYYEPVQIDKGESSSFYLLLSSLDAQGFAGFRPSDGLSPRGVAIQAIQALGGVRPGATGSSAPAQGSASLSTPRTGPQNVNTAIVRSDYNALQDIIGRIERSLESGSPVSDDEIASMEQDLARIKSRYNNQ